MADERLGDEVRAAHHRSRCTYGSPRVHRALRTRGLSRSGRGRRFGAILRAEFPHPCSSPRVFLPAFLSRPDPLIAERSRLGIAAERGPVSAVVVLEDAREYGSTGSAPSDTTGLPVFEPHEAYLEVHTADREVFFRLGRQELVLGDGRLVGLSDDSPTGRALDAASFAFRVKNYDVQAFAAMLTPPVLSVSGDATGTQLFAVDTTLRAAPLFSAEIALLVRIARGTSNTTLPLYTPPSDTVVPWLRLFGSRRGFRYSVTGAFEWYQVLDPRFPAIAGAAAARAEWETTLPGRLTFGLDAAYASGGENHFDPILPDEAIYGQAGFIAWTNQITAAFDVALSPVNAIQMKVGYRFAGLADPFGEWTSSSLVDIGSSRDNHSRELGHIVDASVAVAPRTFLTFKADYSAMIPGAAAKAIFKDSRSMPMVLYYGLLETTVRFP